MTALFANRIALLTTSFVLFLAAVPLISIGTTRGPRALLWIGLAALCVGALIPPLYRLCCAPKESPDSDDDDEDENVADNATDSETGNKREQ